MKKKDFIVLGVGMICMLLAFGFGFSFALWTFSQVQNDTNIVTTSCFDIEFKDGEGITLSDAYPIYNEEGLKLTPYTFTIKNTCNMWATYQINLESLEQEKGVQVLADHYIHANLQEETKEVKDTTLMSSIAVDKTLQEAKAAYKLYEGKLKTNETKTYNLRLWIDEETEAKNEVMNAIFKAKVTVIFSAIPAEEEEETTTLNYIVDGKSATSAPSKGNYTVTVDCGSTATANWDSNNWKINITKRNVKDVVCTITFANQDPIMVSGSVDTVGSELRIGNEYFYVIGSNSTTVTLLSKYNLNLSTNKQYGADATSYGEEFSTSGYWSSSCTSKYPCNVNGITSNNATAVNVAKSYGTKLGGTGRLLTYEELGTLVNLPSSAYGGEITGNTEMLNIIFETYVTQNNLSYWLASAFDGDYNVWYVYRLGNELHLNYEGFDCDEGIRPVIEISKSLVKNVE